jgi:hypothetical protein
MLCRAALECGIAARSVALIAVTVARPCNSYLARLHRPRFDPSIQGHSHGTDIAPRHSTRSPCASVIPADGAGVLIVEIRGVRMATSKTHHRSGAARRRHKAARPIQGGAVGKRANRRVSGSATTSDRPLDIMDEQRTAARSEPPGYSDDGLDNGSLEGNER